MMIGGMTSRMTVGLLFVVAVMAKTITGCGSELQPDPTATADIPATVSAAVAISLGTPSAQPTTAPLEPKRAATAPVTSEP